jgi:hypothetical protein
MTGLIPYAHLPIIPLAGDEWASAIGDVDGLGGEHFAAGPYESRAAGNHDFISGLRAISDGGLQLPTQSGVGVAEAQRVGAVFTKQVKDKNNYFIMRYSHQDTIKVETNGIRAGKGDNHG